MNTYNPKHQQKSKSMPSSEQNYFVHFAMRYPVVAIPLKIIENRISKHLYFVTKDFMIFVAKLWQNWHHFYGLIEIEMENGV